MSNIYYFQSQQGKIIIPIYKYIISNTTYGNCIIILDSGALKYPLTGSAVLMSVNPTVV